jgi:hypothetical protein
MKRVLSTTRVNRSPGSFAAEDAVVDAASDTFDNELAAPEAAAAAVHPDSDVFFRWI